MAKSIPAHAFTVGWICALPVELAAAAEIMDEEFADLPSLPTESNLYSFGRIGVHNVVAVCLPAGQMGTNQAAAVASQMRQTFPSLRFGVLVGIGGGVPCLDDDIDIRLGDVVISQPAGLHGGVVQYDFGKTGPEGGIARTGACLNTPPTILLNALAKLRANDLRGKTKISTHLTKVSSQPRFTRPGPGQDTLYDASSVHVTGATCAKCRPEDAVDREPRATNEPVLFFGTIASGNQVMRDGPTRDRYSRELGGVLCFEMEAAGLMNNFPCLVVRGICDYADAHKNKRWQPYAAATAAAYTKELLSIVPPVVDWDKHETPHQTRHFIVPFARNKAFVGRERILAELLDTVPPASHEDDCQRTVVEGLGGVGKTQIAIEATYRVRETHPDCSVFWVPAVNMAMFENAYAEIGRALGVSGIDEDKADVKKLVKAALSHADAGQWLLVIDNVDDMLLLTDGRLMASLPFSFTGSILLTTRNHQVAVRLDGRGINLPELDEPEAAELLHQRLQKRQIDNPKHTTELLNNLAYLPLAIRQASAYMELNSDVTISKYLGFCSSSDKERVNLLSEEFTDQTRYETIRNPVALTWLISFEHIARDKPLAAEYLQSICYLAEKDILATLFPSGASDKEASEAISTLEAYAFLQRKAPELSTNMPHGVSDDVSDDVSDEAPDRFDVHRLVRLVMRNWLREQQREQEQVSKTMSRLAEVLPWPKHGNRKAWSGYLPHTQTILDFMGQCIQSKALWRVFHNTGEMIRLNGKFADAEYWYRKALGVAMAVLGQEDPDTLANMTHLANMLGSLGRLEEAETMHRQTLKLLQKVLGSEHPLTLNAMGGLSTVLRNQGKYDEAASLQIQTLTGYKRVLGPENPDTLTSMANLASVLFSQGKYLEAEKMNREVFVRKKTVLGREHPDTLSSMNNLALTLRHLGRLTEAETMLRQTLAHKETALGREHPETLGCLNNLALTLRQLGKHTEAETMQRQTLARTEAALGRTHPQTFNCLNNLAVTLWELGKHTEAETMQRQTLARMETALARTHPDTLSCMKNLALTLRLLGKHAEAETMLWQTLARTETALGRTHPKTLDTLDNLVDILQQQGKCEEAESLCRKGRAWKNDEDTGAAEEERGEEVVVITNEGRRADGTPASSTRHMGQGAPPDHHAAQLERGKRRRDTQAEEEKATRLTKRTAGGGTRGGGD